MQFNIGNMQLKDRQSPQGHLHESMNIQPATGNADAEKQVLEFLDKMHGSDARAGPVPLGLTLQPITSAPDDNVYAPTNPGTIRGSWRRTSNPTTDKTKTDFLLSVTASKLHQYNQWSFEELRLIDYQHGKIPLAHSKVRLDGVESWDLSAQNLGAVDLVLLAESLRSPKVSATITSFNISGNPGLVAKLDRH
jgi:hypothetical protein